MKMLTAARRIVLAANVLAGKMDDRFDAAAAIAERDQLIANLRKVLQSVHDQRMYWYNLWFTMGREFEATQDALITEIDQLRQKLGIDGKKYEQVLKQAFHDRFVAPGEHPVQGITVEGDGPIQSPPVQPPEVRDGN